MKKLYLQRNRKRLRIVYFRVPVILRLPGINKNQLTSRNEKLESPYIFQGNAGSADNSPKRIFRNMNG